MKSQLDTRLPVWLKDPGGSCTCLITWDECGLAALQGSADDVNLTPQRPSANGNFGTPSGGAFATPASVASQHSLEDEETLLLDPQVPTLNSSLCQSWLYGTLFGFASAPHILLPVHII